MDKLLEGRFDGHILDMAGSISIDQVKDIGNANGFIRRVAVVDVFRYIHGLLGCGAGLILSIS